MNCPFCQNAETSVIDSREAKEGAEIRRRRQCAQCEKRFTTYERTESVFPWVVKKDGSRVEFDSVKIRTGVLPAIEKRPVSIDDAEALVQAVLGEMAVLGEKEVLSSKIGESVMLKLKKLDKVAYVRFASVYREFKDINDFMSELSDLKKK